MHQEANQRPADELEVTPPESPIISDDDRELIQLGYTPQLERRLGLFSSFSLGFNFICIVAGCITSFQEAASAVGGAGIGLGWPLGCLIALCVAWPMVKLARAYPVSGSLFHWSTMLGGRGWGWATGWFSLAGLVIVTATIDVGTWQILATGLLPRLGIDPGAVDGFDQFAAVVVLSFSHAALAAAGVRMTGRIASVGTILILVTTAAITVALVVYAPHLDFGRLVTFTNFSGAAGGGVWPTNGSMLRLFLLSLLLPTYTITGFDAPGHAAEETVGASSRVPRAVLLSVLISAGAGWLLTAALVVTPPSFERSVASGADFAFNAFDQLLPHALAIAILASLVISNYLCGFVAFTTTTRALWSFARTDGVPLSDLMKRIDPRRHVPSTAAWATAGLIVLAACYGPAYAALAAASVILLYISYVMPPAAGLWAAFLGRRSIGGFPLKAGFLAPAALALVGTAILFYAGIQPPSNDALWIVAGTMGILLLSWFAIGRARYRGGPEVRLRAAIEAAFSATPGIVRRSLEWRVIFPVGLIVLALGAVALYRDVALTRTEGMAALKQRSELTVRVMAQALADPVWETDLNAAQHIANSIIQDPAFISMRVLNLAGDPMIALGPTSVADPDVVVDRAEMRIGANRVGEVLLTLSSAPVEAHVRERALRLVGIYVTGVAILIVVLLIVVRSLTRPILSLAAAMGELSGGQLDGAIPSVERTDEIGTMARAVEVFKANAEELRRVSVERVALAEASENAAKATLTTLEMIAEVGQQITAALDIEQVFDMLYSYISTVMEADVFYLALLDEDGERIIAPYFVDGSQRHRDRFICTIDNPEFGVAQSIREQRTVLIENTEERAKYFAAKLGASAVRKLLFHPLTFGETRLGAMAASSRQIGLYGERDQFIFRTLASYAAVAIANARLYAEMEQRVVQRTLELNRAMAELELILNNAALGVTTVAPQPDGRRVYTRANQAAERIFGYGPGQMIGMDTREIFLNDEAYRNLGVTYGEQLSKGETVRAEVSYRHTSGRAIIARAIATAIDSNDLAKGVIWLIEDITAQRAVEEEIKRARKEAEDLADAVQNKNEQVRALLDSSGQGFLSFGADLIVSPEYSRACIDMLGAAPGGRPADEALFGADAKKSELLRSATEKTFRAADPVRKAMFLSLLPRRIERDARLLDVEYKALDDRRIMVVLTDVTEKQRLAEAAAREQRRQRLIVSAVTDSRNLFDTLNAFKTFTGEQLPGLLGEDAPPTRALQQIYLHVHTLKGLLSQASFDATPRALHAIEDVLNALGKKGDRTTFGEIAHAVRGEELERTLEEELAVLRESLGANFLARGGMTTLSASQSEQLERMAADLLRGKPIVPDDPAARAFFDSVVRLNDTSIHATLLRYDWVVQQIATRQGKRVAPVEVEGDSDIVVDPERYGPLLRSLVHVFRNTVAHGIETPELRALDGKSETGHVRCRVARTNDQCTIVIADDGQGIDPEAVARHAVAAGTHSAAQVAAMSDEEVTNLIFHDGVSTGETVDDFSGRGVGLTAVRAEATRLGGEVTVRSQAKRGTEFQIRFPLH